MDQSGKLTAVVDLEAAAQEATLDVYDGMWHVFQTSPSPEIEVSLWKISAFLHQHLTK